MKNAFKCSGSNFVLNFNSNRVCSLSNSNLLTTATNKVRQNENKKTKHPFKNVHPWKSFTEFSESLIKNVFYNKDGLVALNKPYGIASRSADQNDVKQRYQKESLNKIYNAVDYSLSNSLPLIAKSLGYLKLTVVRSPERYMSGVTLLAANKTVENNIIKAHNRAVGFKKIPKTYWIVTTKLPKEIHGSKHLAMKLHRSPCKKFERPVIQSKWSNLQVKKQEVKILNVEYRVLSNSTDNLSALIEIKSSTTKWHAIRLFAATVLYSPILGDTIHGSRLQNIMGAWMRVNPFLPSVDKPPKVDRKLLDLLNLSTAMQEIIPVHIHLKRFELPWYLGHGNDLVLEAPLTPEFSWTCHALDFQLPTENVSNGEEVNNESKMEQVL